MKKLISTIVLGSLLLTGAAIAQDHEPIRARDGTGTENFGVPNRLRDNQEIQDCVGEYREAREAMMQQLKQLRLRLATAPDAEKAAIQEQIRAQLKTHLGEQREFRKSVRGMVRELRKERVGGGAGNGNGNGG